MNKVLFALAFFFAYTIQAISGFAGNTLAVPAGVQLIGMTDTIAVLNAMGFFACGLLAVTNLKYVNWKEYARIIVVMIVFMLVGIWIDTVLPVPLLLKIYGIVIVLVGLKNLFFPSKNDLPEWALWIILALAGIIQGMFVSGGALLVIYAIQKLKDKQQFRITLSLVWATLNVIYAGIAISAGQFTQDVIMVILICIPLAIAATFLGNYLQKKVSQEKFQKLVYGMLIVIGVVLLCTP